MKVSQIVQVYFMTMQSWFKLLQLIFLVSIQGQIQTLVNGVNMKLRFVGVSGFTCSVQSTL